MAASDACKAKEAYQTFKPDVLRFPFVDQLEANKCETTNSKSSCAALPLTASAESIPSLDNTAGDSSVGDADDSSVSTSGSSTPVMTRSLFSGYWVATGQVPALPSLRKPTPQAHSCSPMATTSKRRSIILNASSRSYSSLATPVVPKPQMPRRRSSSNGDLSRSELTPCLRRNPIYSGDSSRRRLMLEDEDDNQSTTSSVRFDLDANDVRHFEVPKEVHAEDGWSNFFH
eukprot:Nitzschia sp. Nitz4//scaffold276_size25055//9859//10548//NITZ4_008340-RA/size25055-processed-gene-0.11-mRNA-1//-1//CDS//3329545322//2574//frame0